MLSKNFEEVMKYLFYNILRATLIWERKRHFTLHFAPCSVSLFPAYISLSLILISSFWSTYFFRWLSFGECHLVHWLFHWVPFLNNSCLLAKSLILAGQTSCCVREPMHGDLGWEGCFRPLWQQQSLWWEHIQGTRTKPRGLVTKCKVEMSSSRKVWRLVEKPETEKGIGGPWHMDVI